jgi:hypothetical protein
VNPNLAFLWVLEPNVIQPSDNNNPIITLYWQGASCTIANCFKVNLIPTVDVKFLPQTTIYFVEASENPVT